MSRSASEWIEQLSMVQHIEGGWYREVYRSALVHPRSSLPPGFAGDRPACTHIFFLLEQKGFSAFHRIQSDELWHFYDGDPLIVYEINAAGHLTEHLLGTDPGRQQSLFCVIRAGSWFGSRVAPGSHYSLVGCTVAPGFDFADFELADRAVLQTAFPAHAQLIASLTHP